MADGEGRTILVVDSDQNVLAKVKDALVRLGYEVQVATDGALAINRALSAAPELIVTAVEMPLLDGFKLCQLLRSNPVTRLIPFIFLTTKTTSPIHLGRYLRTFDDYLLKPFKEEDLAALVKALFLRLKRVRSAAPEETKALVGTLTEMALVDLLQVLRMNRRSGQLTLEKGHRKGVIYISDGETVNAELGTMRGEKAFIRFLAWDRGTFDFRPQEVATETLIERPGENLILDGLRQIDEVEKLRVRLAPPGSRLTLLKEFTGPPERLKPVTREVIRLLGYFSSLDELLDQCAHPDLAICETLKTLVDKGIIGVSTVSAETETAHEEPLFSLQDALKLSYQLGVGREEEGRRWTGKLLLFGSEPEILRGFLEKLARIREFRIDAGQVLGPKDDQLRVGPVGSLQIMEGTGLRLFAFPGDGTFRPLWEALSQHSVGAIVLSRALDPLPDAAWFCAAGKTLPFLVCGPGLPEKNPAPPGGEEWNPATRWGTCSWDETEESVVRLLRRFISLIVG